MTIVQTKAVIEMFVQLFDRYNASLFAGELTSPNFVWDPAKRKGVLHYTSQSHAISIGKAFEGASMEQIEADLIHQMIHIENALRDIKDQTVNEYHNANFYDRAIELGLFVYADQSRKGWHLTSLTRPKGVHADHILEPDSEVNGSLRTRANLTHEEREVIRDAKKLIRRQIENKSQPYFRKFVCCCPTSHNSSRCGRHPDGKNPLRDLCLNCGHMRILEGTERPTPTGVPYSQLDKDELFQVEGEPDIAYCKLGKTAKPFFERVSGGKWRFGVNLGPPKSISSKAMVTRVDVVVYNDLTAVHEEE